MNDHRDLMVYEDERGLRQRVIAVADWEKRRARILDAMQAVMGSLPGADRRGALDMRIEEETEAGSYLRRKISFVSEPLAPRAFLAVAPVRDSNFNVIGVREVMDSARPVYRLYGAEANLQAEYPDAGHTFPPASREQAYRLIQRILMG